MSRFLTYRNWPQAGALVLLVSLLQLTTVDVARSQSADSAAASSWRFSITPQYWASAIAGSLTLEQPNDPLIAGNYVVDIGHKEELNPGFIVGASAGKGRWGAQLGVAASSVSDNTDIRLADSPRDSLSGNYDFSWSEASARGTYRVGPYLSPWVTVYAGIRWINWKYDLFDDANGTLGSWDETWIDPMVGAQTTFGLGAGFSAHAHFDAAGFKIGGSELSYTVSGGLAYHVAGPLTLIGTYGYKQVSYDNGKTGDELFIWKDGVAQGWIIGVRLAYPGTKR